MKYRNKESGENVTAERAKEGDQLGGITSARANLGDWKVTHTTGDHEFINAEQFVELYEYLPESAGGKQ